MSNCGKIRSFKVWQIVISNCVTAEIKLNSSATSFFTFVLSNLVVNSNHIFCFCFPTFTGFFSFFFFSIQIFLPSIFPSFSLSLSVSLFPLPFPILCSYFRFASFRLSLLGFGILSSVFYGYHVYLIFLLFLLYLFYYHYCYDNYFFSFFYDK